MSDDDNLFSRWSRRKRLVAEEEAVARVPEPETAEPEAPPDTPEGEAALLERLNLPVPESLKKGDDFSVFMQAGVPEFLRKRALRVLWRSNPVLANIDGLNDYDDDFNSPELTQKIIATGYKIGRGFLKEKADPEILQDFAAKDTGDDASPEESDVVQSKTGRVAEETIPEVVHGGGDDAEEEDFSFSPKRMRFET